MSTIDVELVRSANATPIEATVAMMNSSAAKKNSGLLLVLFPFTHLPAPLLQFAFGLVKSNLMHLYLDAQDTGWSERSKMEEMSDKDGRYLIAFKREGLFEEQASKVISHLDYSPLDSDTPVGYLYYIMCMQDSYDDCDGGMGGDGKAPVIYCMELQMTPDARNLGLGTAMMQMMEDVGRGFKLRRAMLTAFKKNEGALRFYNRLGYLPDLTSPSQCMSERRAGRYSYEIMRKNL
ncbi:hypothetical protein HDU81_010204 [Chytriomyces hyalinus]|nr:hypothetical protein HDU81_010204 [Chytriomyces hyalinus]